MSHIQQLVDETDQDLTFFCQETLSKKPYCLKSSQDKSRPDLIMFFPSHESDPKDPVVCECNGIVFDKLSRKIVCSGMPTLFDTETIPENAKSAELAEDGTVLRVWWYKTEWVASTNRRIDSRRVKWSSDKTFYELLSSVFDTTPEVDFEAELDKKYVYSFILLHPENHLVVFHPKPELVLVSKRNITTGQEEKCEVPFSFCRLSNVVTDFDQEDAEHRGFIFSDWTDPMSVIRTKKDYTWFKSAHSLRKNYPTLGLSYLAANYHEKGMLRHYFPGAQSTFDSMDYHLHNIAKYIHESYFKSFVKKLYQIPKDHTMYPMIRRIHRNFMETRVPTNFTKTCDVVYTSNPWILQRLMYELCCPTNVTFQNV